MSEKEEMQWTGGHFMVAVISFLVGVGLGSWAADETIKQEAIDREFAEYESKTGEWRWKEWHSHPRD